MKMTTREKQIRAITKEIKEGNHFVVIVEKGDMIATHFSTQSDSHALGLLEYGKMRFMIRHIGDGAAVSKKDFDKGGAGNG